MACVLTVGGQNICSEGCQVCKGFIVEMFFIGFQSIQRVIKLAKEKQQGMVSTEYFCVVFNRDKCNLGPGDQ